MKYRQNRINDSVAQTVGEIFRSVKDPRISSGFVTVNAAVVTKDLKFAKIYYSVFGECDEKELAKGLKSAVPFVRSQLAQRLNLRITPDLTFVRDEGVKHGAEISKLLREIAKDTEPAEEDEDDDE